jgi:hypothetical protein
MKIDNPIERLPMKKFMYSSIGLSFFTALVVIALKGLLPPEVPLFYGKPTGEEQLVPTLGLLIAPGVSLLIVIINTIFVGLIKDLFLKKTLIVSSLFVSLLTTITVFKIVFLVGFF